VKEFLPLTMSGLGVIILLGRFWRRATWQGALAALIATPAVSLALKFLPVSRQIHENAIIPATVAGLLAHLLVSGLTPASARRFEEVAVILDRERQAIEGGPGAAKGLTAEVAK